jgi:Mg2+ and Co2+ transporter CorA
VVSRLSGPSRRKEPKWADWMLYALLNAITDLYMAHVNGIVNEGENLDELVRVFSGVLLMGKVLIFNAEEKEDVLKRVGLARHFVTNLVSHLW